VKDRKEKQGKTKRKEEALKRKKIGLTVSLTVSGIPGTGVENAGRD